MSLFPAAALGRRWHRGRGDCDSMLPLKCCGLRGLKATNTIAHSPCHLRDLVPLEKQLLLQSSQEFTVLHYIIETNVTDIAIRP